MSWYKTLKNVHLGVKMMDVKKLAIQIADEFSFEPYEVIATATTEGEDAKSSLSRCENHLDNDFMKSLENYDFLDTKYLSKSR